MRSPRVARFFVVGTKAISSRIDVTAGITLAGEKLFCGFRLTPSEIVTETVRIESSPSSSSCNRVEVGLGSGSSCGAGRGNACRRICLKGKQFVELQFGLFKFPPMLICALKEKRLSRHLGHVARSLCYGITEVHEVQPSSRHPELYHFVSPDSSFAKRPLKPLCVSLPKCFPRRRLRLSIEFGVFLVHRLLKSVRLLLRRQKTTW